MLRLLYLSQASSALTKDQVQKILESSRRNNLALGLTGVLIHGGGLFMQVLEGPEQAVLRMYLKILEDKRHINCKIIYITPIDKRIFEGWSMGAIDRDDVLGFDQIMELHHQRKEVVQAKVFTNAMHEFLDILKSEHG